ncbi:UDP-2,4-diacetamido-2,4,6-trideoxy-beta-L-altropyranose hydrolase [Pontimicrobium sp. MEBiC01747]
MKIVFRADGNAITGLGHLYRLFSLVEVIKESFEFIFLTHESSIHSVIPKTYNTSIVPKSITIEDEPEWIMENYPSSEHIIVADGYQFITSYQKKIKELGYNLVYIDDLAKEYMYADIVINHSPYIKESHYKKETYTKLILGTQYALLRPLFLKEAKQNKEIKTIDSAFICFGGADPFNLTFKAVKALLTISKFKAIHVVLGGAYKHKEIIALEKEYPNKIKTYKNLSEKDLIKTMQACNYAIAPASTILYELCCVKMPILSGYYVDNQELIYKGFLENKAVYKGGNIKNYLISDFIEKTKEILKQQHFNSQIEAQNILFDKKIAFRHLNLIKELC